ncbi:MAG TPA: GNAT family N-acetyltransferase [Terriglobales bacterium]|nr:GNAT family N-acetyltransferase [Terriglobales bacterium]
MSEVTKGKLRRLKEEDIPFALELSIEAGWNQTTDDWRMLIELAPESCFGIEIDGELAASTTLLCYGTRLAWMGMVLTRIKFRGQGLAKRLLSNALKLASQMNIETVKLDATDQGRPLYEKLGFRCEQPVERWTRTGTGNSIELPAQSNTLSSELISTDQEAFAADRSRFLEKLSQRNPPFLATKSFLFARPGNKTAYLGPCVSENASIARSLIERCVQDTTSAISWDLLKLNRESETIAKDLGFTPQRCLTRMVRGRDLRGREESIYALGGFEFG